MPQSDMLRADGLDIGEKREVACLPEFRDMPWMIASPLVPSFIFTIRKLCVPLPGVCSGIDSTGAL